jgi:hypothetical protein
MSTVDPRVAAVLDRTQQNEDSDDEDALIAELEEDEGSLAAFREQRLQQLHGELARAKAQRNSDYGTYMEIKEEKQLMDITTSSKLCVVHFMKPDFNRCRIMDQRLAVRPSFPPLLPYTSTDSSSRHWLLNTSIPASSASTSKMPLSLL